MTREKQKEKEENIIPNQIIKLSIFGKADERIAATASKMG